MPDKKLKKSVEPEPVFTEVPVQTVFKKVTWRQKLLWGIGLAAAIFLLLNSPFLWKNLQFVWHHPEPQSPGQSAGANTTVQPDMLWIDSLNITAPIKYVDEANEAVFQEALQDGAVHYPGTALPGQPGNVYIFGHSSDYIFTPGDYKTVFALLPRISEGAEIKVTDRDGHLYTYVVTRQFVAGPNDIHLLSQYDYKEKLLTIQTSYPIGTALKRYIVEARLKE